MKIELKLNADGKRWDVVKGTKIVQTCDTIKQAVDARFDMKQSRKK